MRHNTRAHCLPEFTHGHRATDPITVRNSDTSKSAEKIPTLTGRGIVGKIRRQIIDVRCIDLSELDREQWEIDENLIRAELTELERAQHTKRREEIISAKLALIPPEEGKPGPKTPGKESARQVAEKTGRGMRSVERDIERIEKIAEDVQDRLADHPEIADKGGASVPNRNTSKGGLN